MTRKYVDCREMPSESGCTIAIAADSERELEDAAVHHAVAAHGEHDTPELRSMIRRSFHAGSPPVGHPRAARA